MNLNDLRKKFIPPPVGVSEDKAHIRNYHPNALIPQPSHMIRRDGEVVAKTTGGSKVCLRCNSEKVMPIRMSGFTLYECLTCRHAWRDSYNKPGQILRPKEWRALGLDGSYNLRPKKWQKFQGRVLI